MNIISLTENYEFSRVYKQGKSYFGRLVVLYVRKTKFNNLRLGLTATKKVGKACIRNRARRLMYENMRLVMPNFKTGYDIVVVARSTIVGTTFFDVKADILKLITKADILR